MCVYIVYVMSPYNKTFDIHDSIQELLNCVYFPMLSGPPHIMDNPLEVIAILYRPVYLACVATGSPKPYVSWKKDNEDLQNDSTHISVITPKNAVTTYSL